MHYIQAAQNYQKCAAHKASLQKLHKYNFKTSVVPSLLSILNRLIQNKPIKARLNQPREGGTGLQYPTFPIKL